MGRAGSLGAGDLGDGDGTEPGTCTMCPVRLLYVDGPMARATGRHGDESRALPRDLLLDVELRRGRLRKNLRETLRSAIQEGRLLAGTMLPSSRTLAADLGVSRGVVTDVYDQLAAEGYLVMTPRHAPTVGGVANAVRAEPEPTPPAWRFDFVATTPDVGLFPRRAWVRAVERSLRSAPADALGYGDSRGRIELRLAVADYLARVRGVRTGPERIVITQGFRQALDLLCRTLAARGSTTLAFETPSLPDAWATARASGLELVACPVDQDGLRVDRLHRMPAAAVVVTPAHQFPTGAVMAPTRRTALVSWAAGAGRLIVEDDYDAEFRFDRPAVGALQGLDPGRVVHVGTASKTLAPGVRLGWMSLPADLVGEVRASKAAADSGSPAIDQLALADLISTGEYDRQVGRARHLYRRRRDQLVDALSARLPQLPVDGAAAGLHVLLRLPDGVDDDEVAREAGRHGIGVRALSPMLLASGPERGLVLGYGRLRPDSIYKAVAALARIVKPAAG
ncbi:MAG: aminotransferase class I/II-fold pyridoxal phosphate-dependent enzyme [Propionibacteriales bacterium]|nr:aminotransferase class I/II-fold pyridoxal phosphate-dependent enzyme [Propionibacteriales bacterium]